MKPSRYPLVIVGYGTFLLAVTIVWNLVAGREVFEVHFILVIAGGLLFAWTLVGFEWRKYWQQCNNEPSLV